MKKKLDHVEESIEKFRGILSDADIQEMLDKWHSIKKKYYEDKKEQSN